MRKYLATIFGVAVGVTAAILAAARADDEARRAETETDGQKGGA